MTPEHHIQTGSQTVGPFFHYALIEAGQNILVNAQTAGSRITLTGIVTDGDGEPVPDAFLEIWQADSQGVYNHPSDPKRNAADPNFKGFGRAATDAAGRYHFETIKPGVNEATGPAPYINVRVFARGMLIHAVTRIYFDDEPANAEDAVLSSLDPARRNTLLATLAQTVGRPHYQHNIRLQGTDETVFFDV